MNSRIRFPISVLAGLIAVIAAHFAYYYPLLPETVASHFDASGTPNGWMSKAAFVVIMGFVVVISAGPTAGIALLLPKMQDAINLPNKKYWMAQERRDETLAYVASALIWIECAVVVLLLVINQYVFRMNIEGEQRLGLPMIPTLAAFFIVVGGILWRLIVKFRKPINQTNV